MSWEHLLQAGAWMLVLEGVFGKGMMREGSWLFHSRALCEAETITPADDGVVHPLVSVGPDWCHQAERYQSAAWETPVVHHQLINASVMHICQGN